MSGIHTIGSRKRFAATGAHKGRGSRGLYSLRPEFRDKPLKTANVAFGSKADVSPRRVMSALPQKAYMSVQLRSIAVKVSERKLVLPSLFGYPSSRGILASFARRALRLRPNTQKIMATNAAMRSRRSIDIAIIVSFSSSNSHYFGLASPRRAWREDAEIRRP